jgi:Cu+-exporting ATPase
VTFTSVDAFASRTGKGVTGRVDGRLVALGSKILLEEMGAHAADLASTAEALRADGETVMFVAVDGTVAGLIGVTDPIKATTLEAIEQLHREGLRIVMLTGGQPDDCRGRGQETAAGRGRGRGLARAEGQCG